MSLRAQSGADSFLSLVEELAGDGSKVSANPDDVWIHVEPEGAEVPSQGWKLHVSAIPTSAEDVLRAALPVLIAHGTAFKVAAAEVNLYELNQGVAGPGQVGKFITVYPKNDAAAISLATALDEATAGLRGPRVPSDKALSPSSLVHYRYGDFVMEGPPANGTRPGPEAPAADPFEDSGVVAASEQRLIAGRYLITGTLHRSVRGAIHLAVDVPAAKTCVLKRAWRDACAMPDGRDARDRLREEARLIRSLGPDPHFPQIWDLVEHENDLFLVMEYIAGTTWARWAHGEERPEPAAIEEAAADLRAAIGKIHEGGYVHRDLSPANVILRDGGGVALVDFELALPVGARNDSFGAGTPGYMSPAQMNGDPASFADDEFGIEALIYLAKNGRDPDASGGGGG